MRIISGEFRSRRLFTPPDDSVTRPIPDRVKESVFGMLRGHCEGASVFDGFAGTGAVGLEALSRGAARCVFVEQDKTIAGVLARNIELLGVGDRAELVVGDCLGPGALARAPRPLTIAFLDPPYPMVQDALGWRRVMAQLQKIVGLLTEDGIAVLRTPWPLQHRTGPAPAVEPGAKPRPTPRKGKKLDRNQWRKAVMERGELDEAVEERPGAQIEGGAEGEEAAVIARAVPVDLTLAGAKGPETHAYHNMAVHLYMRA